MGTIQTMWAKTAVCQLVLIPSTENHRSSASPSTAWGKKIGSSTRRW